MNIKTKILAAASGLALAASAVITTTAHADLQAKAPEAVLAYQPFTVSVTDCEADGKIIASLRDADGDILDTATTQGAAAEIELVAEKAGKFKVLVECDKYDGSTETQSRDIEVVDTILFDPQSWKAGDPVKLTAYGFAASEAVSLRMVRVKTGEVVWTAAAGNADAAGVFSQSLTLKSDVPQGDYVLWLEGATRKVSAEFYWGQRDADTTDDNKGAKKDDSKKKADGTKTTKPTKKTAKKPGLPKTGD